MKTYHIVTTLLKAISLIKELAAKEEDLEKKAVAKYLVSHLYNIVKDVEKWLE